MRATSFVVGFVFFASCLASCPYDPARKSNNVVYWGQGAGELALRNYCNDSTYDLIFVSFLNNFPTTSMSAQYPTLELSSHCWTFFGDWTSLLHCPSIGADIKYCQSRGKKLLLSLGGGGVGTYALASDAEARTFAQTTWDMFIGGNSTHRPFDDAVLDGVDLDIESGSYLYYAAYITRLREIATAAGKKIYVSAAPQCPFADAYLGPDGAIWSGQVHTGTVLSGPAIDFIAVQFYNNPDCNLGTTGYRNGSWPFSVWNEWARTHGSRVLVGALASSGSGFVTVSQLKSDVSFASQYSNFGGFMQWNAATATSSGRGQEMGAWLKSQFPPTCGGSVAGSSQDMEARTSHSNPMTFSIVVFLMSALLVLF